MYRTKYSTLLNNPTMLDYGTYLECERLLTCQKPLDSLCNGDELQFQIVHQVEELWMKLMIYTLIEVLENIQQERTLKVLNLMQRVHFLQRMMIQQLDVLETMSPKEYQEIRLQLGNGSGQESPGFRTLLKVPADLWDVYKQHYLDGRAKTVEQIYNSQFAHDDSYAVAEALLEFDELLQKFRTNHIFLIQRSIGLASKSLKGRPVELLENGAKHRFFPELWNIRSRMTDTWGGEYGQVRESISQCPFHS
ncbi:MAG: tryptophan 2,3-dioxygenase family protein [Paraglaciecola sp.]|uniref:tryptophan 2,3-dioxygenase family protein n=1 Tax=Pseudomonadati TaxID=3379134 RepID=UPI00273EE825|nr:tryptophan 2,3-dioxygenase family protein [Paraglaciecola sp.]MDP5029620.1 tryptophan 2,3-dioxygenase family protein [Paraglaciecola sp.]MDP5041097.1 tryptophan 2,3-dioxygenase family protein [Paraglaciecola sp.]MDP5133250.1 tryptophan 2,3-dioxygenase family protein [Paraglaciecola sp.]